MILEDLEKETAIQLLAEIMVIMNNTPEKNKPLYSKDFLLGMCFMGNLMLQDGPAFVTGQNTLHALQYTATALRKYYSKEFQAHLKKYNKSKI